MDDDDPIDPVLVERFAEGNGTVFVGAGISASSGMPLWNELMDPIRSDLGDEVNKCTPHYEIAELFETRYSRGELVRYLKRRLDRPTFQLTKSHELIVKLPVQRIYTTNFDDLLEQASTRQGIPRNVISDASQVTFADTSALSIIKLHGDLNHLASLVFASSDYYGYFTKNPTVADLLKVELQTHTILFLGYSFSDVNLGMILGKAAEHSGRERPLLYSLQLRPKELARQALARRGVKVIAIDADHNSPEAPRRVEHWLRSFTKALRRHNRRSVPVDWRPSVPASHYAVPPHKLTMLRHQERKKLDAGIESGFRVIIVKGEAGIGKTQLVAAAVEDALQYGGVNLTGEAFERVIWLRPAPAQGAAGAQATPGGQDASGTAARQAAAEADPPRETMADAAHACPHKPSPRQKRPPAGHDCDRILEVISNSLDTFNVTESHRIDKKDKVNRLMQAHRVIVVIEDLEEDETGDATEKIKEWLEDSGPFARPASRIIITSRSLLLPGYILEVGRLNEEDTKSMMEEHCRHLMFHSRPGYNSRIKACTFGNPRAIKMALGLVNGVHARAAERAAERTPPPRAWVMQVLQDMELAIKRALRLEDSDALPCWSRHSYIEIEAVFEAIHSVTLWALSDCWQLAGEPRGDRLGELDRALKDLPAQPPDAWRVLYAMLAFPQGLPVPRQLLKATWLPAASSGEQVAHERRFGDAVRNCVRFGLLEHDVKHDSFSVDRATADHVFPHCPDLKVYEKRLADHLLGFLRGTDEQEVAIRRNFIRDDYWNALVRDEMSKIDPYWPIIENLMTRAGPGQRLVDFVLLLAHYMDSRFLHSERARFLALAIEHLDAEKQPATRRQRALLKIDGLASIEFEKEDYKKAAQLVNDGLFLLAPDPEPELEAIANVWKARIATRDAKAVEGEPAEFIAKAKKNYSSLRPWIQMRVKMMDGDIHMTDRNSLDHALKAYMEAERLAQSYGGEGNGYQTSPRIALAQFAVWKATMDKHDSQPPRNLDAQCATRCPAKDDCALRVSSAAAAELKRAETCLRQARHRFQLLERERDIAASRLNGKYGLALIAASHQHTHEALNHLRSMHQEIFDRGKGNALLTLAEDLYKQIVREGVAAAGV